MTDKKISALTTATTPLVGTEVVPVVQSGTTVKVPVSDLTAGRDTSFKTGTATPRNGVKPTNNSVVTGLTIFNDQDNVTGDGVDLFLDHSYGTPGIQTRGVKLSSYSTAAFSGAVGAKLQVTSGGAFLESVDFKDNGDVKINAGNLVQGTAAKGVNFTANTPAAGMTSQLLNWYEEGTWTPTLTRDTPPTFTYGTVVGKYTRIGNQVTATGTMFFTVTAAGGGLFYIGGLPFAANSTSGYSASGSISYSDAFIGDAVYVGASGTTMPVTVDGAFSTGGFATGRIYFTITYQV